MKIFTSACLVASLLLCFVLVWLFAQVAKPGQVRAAKIRDVQEMQITTVLMLGCLVGSGVGSVIIVRRARHEYRQEATELMQHLVEETRKDSKRTTDA